MQVLMTASKQSQDGTSSILTLHETYQCQMYSEKIPDDGQRRCPKHVEFYNRINLDN